MKTNLLLASAILCLTACNSGDDTKKTSAGTTAPTTPTPSVTELATALDEMFLKQIKLTMDIVETDELWQGYDYKSVPQYFIRKDKDNAVTAFVINPQTTIDKAQKLGSNESQGLNVVSFEGSMYLAMDKLTAGNGYYDFDFKIEGKDYYIQSFTTDSVDIKHPMNTSAFALAVHEVFHDYQQDNFKTPSSYQQLAFDKFHTYPLGQNLLALQLMFLDLAKGFPVNNMPAADAKEALKKYVVIVNEMLKNDPTAHSGYQTGLIYKHGLGQELFEGSALYIDQMVSRKVLPITSDNKFITVSPFKMDQAVDGYTALSKKSDVSDYFAFNVFYATGANAVWLLSRAGYDIKALESGIYPYDAAKDYLNMSEIEEMELLAQLKSGQSWSQAQAAAKRYSSLK